MRQVSTADELDALAVGSVILDLGRGYAEAGAPVVACKAAHGEWHVMGQPSDRFWRSEEVVRGSNGGVLVVAYDSIDGVREATRAQA